MSDPSDDRFRPDFIEAAREGLEPTAADRARLRRSIAAQIVGIATVTATAAGASGASAGGGAAVGGAAVGGAAVAASAAGSSILFKVLVGTLALSAVVALGTVVVRDRQGDASTHTAPPIPTPTAIAVPPPPVLPSPPAPSDPPTATSSVVAPAAPSGIVAHPTSAPPGGPRGAEPPSATEGELTVETRLLSSAAAALRGGDARGALTLLDEHRRRFPRGVLSEERDAERVFALCAMGSEEEALRSAKQFAREHPRSGLAPRVARACAGR